jgi:hypothetical protein
LGRGAVFERPINSSSDRRIRTTAAAMQAPERSPLKRCSSAATQIVFAGCHSRRC